MRNALKRHVIFTVLVVFAVFAGSELGACPVMFKTFTSDGFMYCQLTSGSATTCLYSCTFKSNNG
jgi:hypothetical protein